MKHNKKSARQPDAPVIRNTTSKATASGAGSVKAGSRTPSFRSPQAATDRKLINDKVFGALGLLGTVVLVIGLSLFHPTVSFLTSPASGEILLETEEMTSGTLVSKSAKVIGRPIRSQFGLATAPGTAWGVEWTGICDPGALPFVRLHQVSSPGMVNSVVFRLGDQFSTTTISGYTNGDLIFPDGMKSGASEYSVIFHSALDKSAPQPALALDRIVVGSQIVPKGSPDKNFYLVWWAALAPLLAFIIAARFTEKQRTRTIVAAATAVVAILLLVMLPVALQVLYGGLLLAFLPLLCHASRVSGRTADIMDWVFALGFASLILLPRWGLLMANLTLPPAPDSLDYMQIAREMTHPFDTRHREPAFIWLTKFWLAATAWTPMMMRMLSLGLAYGMAVAAWKLMRLFMGPVMACAVMVAIVFNPALIASSIVGLREEIFPLAFLVQAYFCVTYVRKPESWRFGVLLVMSSLIPLIRLNGLLYAVGSMGMVLWQVRADWRRVAVTAAVMVGFILPSAIYQYGKYGEPFYSSNGYVATFYRNQEFKGKPGFPSAEEVTKNPWAGERVSMSKYVFGMHSFPDVISKSFSGAWSLLAGKSAGTDLMRLNPNVTANYNGWLSLPEGAPNLMERALLLLFFAGCVFAFFTPQGWILLLQILLLQLPLSFMEGADLLYWRLTMNGIPTMLILAGLGVQALLYIIQKLNGKLSTPQR